MPRIRQKYIFGGIRKTLTAIIAVLFVATIFVSENINSSSATTSVTLDATNFPDANFRGYLKAIYDDNKDGALDSGEIAKVTDIGFLPVNQGNPMEVKDLTGVHYFTELQSIRLANHKLAKLDLSNNHKIKDIIVSGNQISSLKLPNDAVINELNISRNRLTTFPSHKKLKIRSLNLSGNQMRSVSLDSLTTLEALNLSGCNLGNVDLSKNTLLQELDLSFNRFSKLDLAALTQLKRLTINNSTGLKVLDLSANVNLTEFTSTGTTIEVFDFSHNTNLEALNLNGVLSSLDLSANTKLDPARCSFGPFNYSVKGREISALDMPGNFNTSRVTRMQGMSIEGDMIKADPSTKKATYAYSVGNSKIPDVEFNLFFDQLVTSVMIADMTNTAPYQQGEKATFKVSVANDRTVGVTRLKLLLSFTDQDGAIDNTGFTIRESADYTIEPGNIVAFKRIASGTSQYVYIDFVNDKNLTGSRTITAIAQRHFGSGVGGAGSGNVKETDPVTLNFSLGEYVEPPVPTGIDSNLRSYTGIVAIGLIGLFFVAYPIHMFRRR